MNQSTKGMAQLLIARCHASKWLAFVEEPCALLTSVVEVLIIVSRGGTVTRGREDREQSLLPAVRSAVRAVLALLHDRLRQRLLLRHVCQPGITPGARMTVPCRAHTSAPGVCISTASGDGGGPATPRASQSRCGVPTGFCSCPRRLRMGADHRRIAQAVKRHTAVRSLAALPAPPPDPARGPTAQAVGDRGPPPEVVREVAPRRSRPRARQDGLDQPPITEGRGTAG